VRGGLTEIWCFGYAYALRVAAFVNTLLNEVLCYGLKCDASLETCYVPYIRFHHVSEDGIDNLECSKRCEARQDLELLSCARSN
jgi:hypothetical protein